MIEINNQEEIEKYYNEKTNTYVFYDDVTFTCDIKVKGDIKAKNIIADNIDVYNIIADNISTYDIDAHNINANDIRATKIIATYIIAHNIDSTSIITHNIRAYNIHASNINANDIGANNISANNINANDIRANNIDAQEIYYYAFCLAYETFKCRKIEGRRKNSFHKCLDNEIEFIKDEEEKMIEINNKKEIEKHCDEKTNTYVFNVDVKFNCNIVIEGTISAKNIDVRICIK